MRLIKKAVEIGNGAAVYVPKEYIGMEIVVTLPDSVEDLKKRILTQLIEFMPNILGVYLCGSYARNEQETDSDADVLVVTKEKDNNIKKVLEDLDARVVSLDELKRTMKNYPLFIMPILREAKTLLNPFLLEELKTSKLDLKKFNWNFDEVKSIIKITQGFLDLGDEDISVSLVYSLIMRMKVCYLIECLLKNKSSNNAGFKRLLLSYGLKDGEIERFIRFYRLVRNGEPLNTIIKREEVLRLLNILKNYLERLEDETKKKIGKGN